MRRLIVLLATVALTGLWTLSASAEEPKPVTPKDTPTVEGTAEPTVEGQKDFDAPLVFKDEKDKKDTKGFVNPLVGKDGKEVAPKDEK